MEFEELIKYLISPAVIGGLIVWYFKAQVEQAKREKSEREKKEIEYRRLVNDYQHATSSLVFWLYKGIRGWDSEHQFFNGDFEKSYQAFKDAERALEEFEQSVFIRQKY